jgi:ATP-dependent helicase/nuclease subunit B
VFERDLRERPALIAYRRRVLDLIPGYVDWLRRRSDAGWRLQSAETEFQVPLRLDLLRTIELSGRIDRIDARGADEREATDRAMIDERMIGREVIDYKARSHQAVRKAAADPGEDIQLPLYALALGAENSGASYLSFERTGDRRSATVRRYPAAEPFARWVRLVEQRLCEDLTRVAAGTGLAALGVDPTCSRCEMRGLCRRNEWGQD